MEDKHKTADAIMDTKGPILHVTLYRKAGNQVACPVSAAYNMGWRRVGSVDPEKKPKGNLEGRRGQR